MRYALFVLRLDKWILHGIYRLAEQAELDALSMNLHSLIYSAKQTHFKIMPVLLYGGHELWLEKYL